MRVEWANRARSNVLNCFIDLFLSAGRSTEAKKSAHCLVVAHLAVVEKFENL